MHAEKTMLGWPGNKMGIDLVRDMFANATKWKLNTVRMYAHTTDPDHPFMVRSCPPPLLGLSFRSHSSIP